MKLRVLEVMVQPFFVIDRDGELERLPTQPLTMSAREFQQFCDQGLLEAERRRLEKQIVPAVGTPRRPRTN